MMNTFLFCFILFLAHSPHAQKADGNKEKEEGDDNSNLPCGQANYDRLRLGGQQNIDNRVEHGQEAPSHSWPWAASVQLKCEGKDGGRIDLKLCSGVLVSHSFVLTAAHCLTLEADKFFMCRGHEGMVVPGQPVQKSPHVFVPPNFVEVRLGGGNLLSTEKVSIKTYTCHPDYNTEGPNDVALVQLLNPVVFNFATNRICAPHVFTPKNNQIGPMIDYGHMFGARENRKTVITPTNSLREEVIQFKTTAPCTAEFICSKHSFRASSRGDSGSGLFVESRGSWWLAGIVKGKCAMKSKDSQSSGCRSSISCFTRTLEFCEWFDKTSAGDFKCHGVI